MDAFATELYVTAAVGIAVIVGSRLTSHILEQRKLQSEGHEQIPEGFRRFQFLSISVFLLAWMANWFYGANLIPLYEEKYEYSAREASILFSVGFVSAMVSGFFVGNLADYIGRKKVCMLYALGYGLQILTHHWSNFWILFLGRIGGGVATAILYGIFESWMVSAHISRGYPGHLIGDTFSWAWGFVYPVAIATGFLSYLTARKDYPLGGEYIGDFDASGAILIIMSAVIIFCWDENYGEKTPSILDTLKVGFRAFGKERNYWIFAIIQTCFEGSMFVWVRFWYGIMKAASGSKVEYNGAACFTLFMTFATLGVELLKILKMIQPKKHILIGCCVISSVVFFLTAIDSDTGLYGSKDWKIAMNLVLFCVFEMCVGIYFNVFTDLRFELIDDSVRASITSLCRVPMNLVPAILMWIDPKVEIQLYCLGAFCAIAAVSAYFMKITPMPEEKATCADQGEIEVKPISV